MGIFRSVKKIVTTNCAIHFLGLGIPFLHNSTQLVPSIYTTLFLDITWSHMFQFGHFLQAAWSVTFILLCIVVNGSLFEAWNTKSEKQEMFEKHTPPHPRVAKFKRIAYMQWMEFQIVGSTNYMLVIILYPWSDGKISDDVLRCCISLNCSW